LHDLGNSILEKKLANLGKKIQCERREKLKTEAEDEVVRYYPEEDEALLPTFLGNVLRAGVQRSK
jgi:hypothetical protein